MNEDNNKSGQSSFAWEFFIDMIKAFIPWVLLFLFFSKIWDWTGGNDPRKSCNYQLGDRASPLDLKTEAMWDQEEVDELNEYCKCFHNYKDAGDCSKWEKWMESK